MMRYFKHEAESDLGFGIAYVEFEDEWASRQVEIYDGRWFCSLEDYHDEIGLGLSDPPLSDAELGLEYKISKEDFESIWAEAEARYNSR